MTRRRRRQGSDGGPPEDDDVTTPPDDLEDDPTADAPAERAVDRDDAEVGEEFDQEADDQLVDDILLEEAFEEEIEVKADRRAGRAARRPGAFRRLYRGQTSFDFVGRRRTWFTISAVIIVAGLISLGVRGLNLGIDFKGGSQWQVLAPGVSQTQALSAVEAAGLTDPTVQVLGGKTISVQADLNGLSAADQASVNTKVTDALAGLAHTTADGVSVEHVGPTWGGQVTHRALAALIVFFIVVGIYISFRFEPKMALAAFIAMVHDLLITIGVFSLAGFQVTPDTVIAILTILGYSLYDTVVVFDRVRDNARGAPMASGRMTYSDMINLSMNQTLARSLNTSLVAILPVLSVLIVGAYILGAVTLQNYGVALTVGLISGAYSSIFIASPVLAVMKEREPRYQELRARVASRSDRFGVLTPVEAAALGGVVLVGASSRSGGPRPGRAGGALRPGGAAAAARAPSGNGAQKGVSTTAEAGANSPVDGDAAPTAAPTPTGPTNRPPPRPRKAKRAKRRR